MIKFEKDTLKFGGMYRGKVLYNYDSSKLGRIKVEVFGVFDGIAASDLPWAIPAKPLFAGAGAGFGCFAVPEVGSYVWCFFESEDYNQPVYFAEATDGVHGLPSERTINYPSRKIIKTKCGTVIYIDDSNGNVVIDATEGSGSITIKGISVDINP